jgi:hypothetical protein
MHDLDSHLAIQKKIFSQIDIGHTAGTNLAEQLISLVESSLQHLDPTLNCNRAPFYEAKGCLSGMLIPELTSFLLYHTDIPKNWAVEAVSFR